MEAIKMGILSRKKKKQKYEPEEVESEETEEINFGADEELKKEVKVLQKPKKETSKEDDKLQNQINSYLKEYGKSYDVLDFVKSEEENKVLINDEIRRSVFKTEVCRLLFAIYGEIKKLNEED